MKKSSWWKRVVEEMTSWQNGKLMKWQANEMASWWNGKFMKRWFDKNDKLMKWLIENITSWQNGKLTKRHVDEMASWQNDTLTKWPSSKKLTMRRRSGCPRRSRSWCQCHWTFFAAKDWQNKLKCLYLSSFKPSLIFARKSRAYPSGMRLRGTTLRVAPCLDKQLHGLIAQ